MWNAPNGVCSSPIAICKEPTSEHAAFLRLMARAGVDFAIYDEQGSSPLDYACLTDSNDAQAIVNIILGVLRKNLREELAASDTARSQGDIDESIDRELEMGKRQAQLRRHYRTIFQESFRPLLWFGTTDRIRGLRKAYADLLSESESRSEMFDSFRFVNLSDSKRLGRLPSSLDGLTVESPESEQTDYVVFVSYRWLGSVSEPKINGPDDVNNTQWQRMVLSVEAFLKQNEHVDSDRVGIWLVSDL